MEMWQKGDDMREFHGKTEMAWDEDDTGRDVTEKWRRGEDFGEVFIAINNVMKAVKNMEWFPCFREVLDDKGYPISRIPCLPSEEVITVFHCGPSELVINELSIIFSSYEGILQHLQMVEAREVQHHELIRRLVV
eukprot:g48342.t1